MKTIVANWKMNGDLTFAKQFMKEINPINTKNTVIVCPPTGLIDRFHDFRYHVGAQDCFYERKGAFTGENSPQLLREIGCRYVIIGHSERRSIFHETNDIVYKKWEAATGEGLIPIVCIGEKLEDRANWRDVLSDQLNLFLTKMPTEPSCKPTSEMQDKEKSCKNSISLEDTIFAYEPVWSIGSGLTPPPAEIENIFKFIKSILQNRCKLLYGGSINIKNAAQILACKNLDGLLIGGASLKIDEFKEIIQL